ncbi:hypothetical protein [uncultured Dysgonomonas sp.]|uniref:Uncharacterized protein n=1 Tax=uncultured Dysgonomonas sp. TaxID=206096 RepID=A0A212K0H1_9BACT|nr:hypothetical protein [uncultured Dysgonomonas sp.]SBW05163.1 conserved hypothetical protein [uncultured Dysgonomonas sp.]
MFISGDLAQSCRAFPGLSLLLALPKSKQKASAKFLGDPQSVCRLKGTNGLSPRHFQRRLHRVGTPPAKLMRVR